MLGTSPPSSPATSHSGEQPPASNYNEYSVCVCIHIYMYMKSNLKVHKWKLCVQVSRGAPEEKLL